MQISRKEAEEKAKTNDDFRKALEEDANSEGFQKFLDEEAEHELELANHPYAKNKKALDEEFELVITYAKNGVTCGTIDAEGRPEGIPIIESILEEENPGALITNDLYIVAITPDVDILIFAEETMTNAVYRMDNTETKDYTIYEYKRTKA
jgi:hypothetical protein